MSSKILKLGFSTQISHNYVPEPEVSSSFTTKSALDLTSSNSNITSFTGITKRSREKSYSAVRRDATEGSSLVRKISSQGQQLCMPQQTMYEIGHQVQMVERVKNININVAADKFLIGTMDALTYNEKEGNFLMASSTEGRGTCKMTMSRMDTESNIRFPCSGLETHGISGDKYSCKDECSPQKKIRQNPRPSRPPLLPPCRVCGDRASGYHYGVNTCEACKGFFRRSICKTEPYVCTGSGDCKTVAGKRTACSHCRFKRCIEVGMSKNAIKTGRYTHELRSKNILEVKRLQKQNSDESPERPSIDSFSSNNDANYTEYKNELLRKMMLEDTLAMLMSGQKMLYEFLDDYYNDDLIMERQLSVYRNYIERKRKLLMQTGKQTAHSDLVMADAQNTDVESDKLAINKTQVDNKSTAQNVNSDTVAQSNGQELHTDVTMSPPKVLNGHNCQTEVNVAQTKLATPTSGNTCDSESSSNIDKNIENKDLDSGSNQPLNLTTQNDCCNVDMDAVKTHTENEAHVTGNDTEGITTDNAVLPPTESLRAEVMTKIVNDLEQGVQGMLAFAKSLPGFSNLPSPDQVSLLKAARFDIWYIGHIRCFNVELRVGACEWQFHADELAQVWGDAMVDLAFTLSRVAKTLDLTKQETAALRAVCLTFPDRCMDLQNRTEVESMHEHMLEVFKYVSCKKRSHYNKWFTKVIDFLVLLREFGVKFEAVSSKLTLDWTVLKDNPVLLSVFLS